MKHPMFKFLVRWLVSGLGIWVAAALLGANNLSYGNQAKVIIIAGFVLAIFNFVLKPIMVLLALPAVLLSLGLFMLVINGLIVMVVSELYPPLYVRNFGVAIVAGIVVGLVNYLVSTILDTK